VECVYSAVRTESINIHFILFITVNLRLYGVKDTFIITTGQANCPVDCVRPSFAQNQLSLSWTYRHQIFMECHLQKPAFEHWFLELEETFHFGFRNSFFTHTPSKSQMFPPLAKFEVRFHTRTNGEKLYTAISQQISGASLPSPRNLIAVFQFPHTYTHFEHVVNQFNKETFPSPDMSHWTAFGNVKTTVKKKNMTATCGRMEKFVRWRF
jgi:hypothetical protein